MNFNLGGLFTGLFDQGKIAQAQAAANEANSNNQLQASEFAASQGTAIAQATLASRQAIATKAFILVGGVAVLAFLYFLVVKL